jgi:hypothetical protein
MEPLPPPLLLEQHTVSALATSPTAVASSRSSRAAPITSSPAAKTVPAHAAHFAVSRAASVNVSAATTPRVRAFTEASVPRRKWYAQPPALKKVPASAARHARQQSAAAAPQASAPSARKWFRPPLSRSLSFSKPLQRRAQQPTAVEQQQPQQQHIPAAVRHIRAGSRLWRRRSTGSISSQHQLDAQQQQLQQQQQQCLAARQSFETDSAANSDDEGDDFLARVPEALQYKEACWPAGSEVSFSIYTLFYVVITTGTVNAYCSAV